MTNEQLKQGYKLLEEAVNNIANPNTTEDVFKDWIERKNAWVAMVPPAEFEVYTIPHTSMLGGIIMAAIPIVWSLAWLGVFFS